MTQHISSEPQVRPTPEVVAAIRKRVRGQVTRVAHRRYREHIAEWASRNDGPMPTRAEAEAEVEAELEVLLRALGGWAAIAPKAVFPAPSIAREVLPWPWEEDE